jgi:hypothetical protein
MRSGFLATTPPPRATHVKADLYRLARFAGFCSSELGLLVDAVASASYRALERVANLGEQVEWLKLQREEVLH